MDLKEVPSDHVRMSIGGSELSLYRYIGLAEVSDEEVAFLRLFEDAELTQIIIDIIFCFRKRILRHGIAGPEIQTDLCIAAFRAPPLGGADIRLAIDAAVKISRQNEIQDDGKEEDDDPDDLQDRMVPKKLLHNASPNAVLIYESLSRTCEPSLIGLEDVVMTASEPNSPAEIAV